MRGKSLKKADPGLTGCGAGYAVYDLRMSASQCTCILEHFKPRGSKYSQAGGVSEVFIAIP
jgi:hypothetical protein